MQASPPLILILILIFQRFFSLFVIFLSFREMLYDYLIFQNSLIFSTIYPTRLILFNEPSCEISFNNKVRDLLRGPHGWLAPSTLILLKRRDKKLNIISLLPIFTIFVRTEQSAQNCFTATTTILIFFSFIHMNNFLEKF